MDCGAVEFQAVILAGGEGARLYPLAEDIPKSLLPIANRPLLSFQLELLERSGFQEVIVVTVKTIQEKIENYIAETYKGKINIELVALDDYCGTADALRHIKDKIKTDFIVISGDLVTDVFIHHIADLHRISDSSMTVLLKKQAPLPPGTPKKKGEAHIFDYIGLDETRTRLLLMGASSDVEADGLSISKALLQKFPNLCISSHLLDAHFYIFKPWVLELLEEKQKISSIKDELVPYLISKQFSASLKELAARSSLNSQQSAHEMSSAAFDETDTVKCSACVMDSGYCNRANTLASYAEMNREIATGGVSVYTPWEPVPPHLLKEVVDANPKSSIGTDCVVAEGLQMGDRCSLKKSVFGAHCKFGNRVKINNSIIMDHVKIGDDCLIQNSIICNNVDIQRGCNIKDCQIGASYTVTENSDIKNEALAEDRD
eukprot:GILJ01004313.1.p1 GENE.GILJ01004313.1~~GILJ01004313.1.p1  ORF type:complete len:431 (-),score=66.67 GILJ01004313.1:51-1343(-)